MIGEVKRVRQTRTVGGRNVFRNSEHELIEDIGENGRESAHELSAEDLDMVRVVDPIAADRVFRLEAFLRAVHEGGLAVGALADVLDDLGSAHDNHPLVELGDFEHRSVVLCDNGSLRIPLDIFTDRTF